MKSTGAIVKYSQNRYLILFTLIVGIQIFLNYIWLKKDTFPLWFDYGFYFKRSIEIYYAWGSGIINFLKVLIGIDKHYPYIPVYRFVMPASSLPWYYIFGISPDIAVISCITFLVISLGVTYGIAARIFDRQTAILSTFILSTSPAFFIFYRRYSPEFATTAMVGLTAYLLMRTEGFNKTVYSLFSGICIALCIFTKEMAFAFIPGILIYNLCIGILSTKYRKRNLANFILSVSIAALFIFLVYWPHRARILYEIFNVAYSKDMNLRYKMVPPYSLKGLSFYLYVMFQTGLFPFYFTFSMVGILFCIIKKVLGKGLLLLWIIPSYAILSTTQTRCFEYFMPLMPPLAMFASYGISNFFRNYLLKGLLFIFVIIWGAGQLYFLSFPVAKLPKWVPYRELIITGHFKQFYPVREDWQLEEIVSYIVENKDIHGLGRVHIGANLHGFSSITLAYVAAQKRAGLEFIGYTAQNQDILSSDFIIIKEGEQGFIYTAEQAKELTYILESRNDFVKLPRVFLLPDGTKVWIYKRIR